MAPSQLSLRKGEMLGLSELDATSMRNCIRRCETSGQPMTQMASRTVDESWRCTLRHGDDNANLYSFELLIIDTSESVTAGCDGGRRYRENRILEETGMVLEILVSIAFSRRRD